MELRALILLIPYRLLHISNVRPLPIFLPLGEEPHGFGTPETSPLKNQFPEQ